MHFSNTALWYAVIFVFLGTTALVTLQRELLWVTEDIENTEPGQRIIGDTIPAFFIETVYETNNDLGGSLNNRHIKDGRALQVKLGDDIDGRNEKEYSGFSVCLSSDGTIVAIGVPYASDDANGEASGHARIYQWDGNNWSQLGHDIAGKAEYNYFGYSLSLSADGNIVAIGSYSSSGYVSVYQFDGTNWNQLGSNIDGENENDNSGWSVSLSQDGKTVAIGAPGNDGINGERSGHVRVYHWDETDWIKLGGDIDGDAAKDGFGLSVSLSKDGTIVAIGAPGNVEEVGFDSGYVRIFKWDSEENDWSRLGYDIEAKSGESFSGLSLSLSADGNFLAIGVPQDDVVNDVRSGHVGVYKWDDGINSFIQLGDDISGEGDMSSVSVSLSAVGTIVAMGAPGSRGANGELSGHVRLFKWDETKWKQVGDDIDGEGDDDAFGFSLSLSADGTVVAVGAVFNDGTGGIESGHVRIYSMSDAFSYPDWEDFEIGDGINGESEGDYSGWSVSLSSDGTIVAIGAPWNDGKNGEDSGHARIYQWDGIVWSQLGDDIDGEDEVNYFGYSVSLSANGMIVAIGAPSNDGMNDGDRTGHVRVFKWGGAQWHQLGDDIDGEYDSNFGHSLSLSSDGTILAIGATGHDGTSDDNSGNVRVYSWDEDGKQWTQMGGDIDGGAEYVGDPLSVSLAADGTTVAVGSPRNNGMNGEDSGHVRVHQWDDGVNSWTKLGNDIDGVAELDACGKSVSLSADGRIIATGAPGNDCGNNADSGQVRVYEWDGTQWIQVGDDICGEGEGDSSGWSVSLSSNGKLVAIGAPGNDGINGAGHVRLYRWDGAEWIKVGNDIGGKEDYSGFSVSLSTDGTHFAVGAPFKSAGHVRIYETPNLPTTTSTTTSTITPPPQSNSLWYPDWEGSNTGCIRDGNEPSYMIQNQGYLFKAKENCCEKFYSWNLGKCMGEGTASSGTKWYPDWLGGDTCVNDGDAPDYMINNPLMWLHDTQESCCKINYSYELSTCMGSASSAEGSGLFYPDWEGENESCLEDNGSTRAPLYMQNNPTSWMVSTLEACCERYYEYNIAICKGTFMSVGSDEWYMDWVVGKCVKDCTEGTDCGGYAESWDIMFKSQDECCKKMNWWNNACMD